MAMLGTSLRTHRKKQKKTLHQVAADCKLSYRAIWKLEHGAGTISCLYVVLGLLELEMAGRNLPPGAHIGESLKTLRLRQGVSLDALSEMAEVSLSGIRTLERTGGNHIAVVIKVADALGAGLYLKPLHEQKSFYTHAGNSSGQDLWQTPKELMTALTKALGEFDLDPCAPRRRDNYTARRGFTAEDDGLNRPWFGKVFINPPYSNLAPWINKIALEVTSEKVTLLAALVPARTDTKWWYHAIQAEATVLFLKGRLKFGNQEQSAPFPSALLFWKLPPAAMARLRLEFPTAHFVVTAPFINSTSCNSNP